VRDHFDRHLTDTDVRALHHALRKVLDGEAPTDDD
jgi:hypothetical protein